MLNSEQESHSLEPGTPDVDEPIPPPLQDFTISFLNYVREQCRPLLAEDERDEGGQVQVAECIDSPSAIVDNPRRETGQHRLSFAHQQVKRDSLGLNVCSHHTQTEYAVIIIDQAYKDALTH